MTDRRRFLASTTAVAAALGMPVPFCRYLRGVIPVALASDEGLLPGKDALALLNDRPLNAETPAHLLDDDVTPARRMFIRNNGIPPASVDPNAWTLAIDGEAAARTVTLSAAELRALPTFTYQLQLECGGNGRSEFRPSAPGNQWTTGAVSCARWTGARLRDVLALAGIQKTAVYVAYWGADRHLSGQPRSVVISRGVPLWKALRDETLVAWALNGADISLVHGAPLRLVAGGFPASASGKWLTRLSIRDRVHDGPKMMGKSYRVPCRPVRPGAETHDEEMCIIESMPVKSLITRPRSGLHIDTRKEALDVRGHAWAGERTVRSVQVSIDFGQTWQAAQLTRPVNRHAWQHFKTSVRFPEPGYYEVWSRAVDEAGVSQPMVVPGWNPKGYLNNACHRIALAVTA